MNIRPSVKRSNGKNKRTLTVYTYTIYMHASHDSDSCILSFWWPGMHMWERGARGRAIYTEEKQQRERERGGGRERQRQRRDRE